LCTIYFLFELHQYLYSFARLWRRRRCTHNKVCGYTPQREELYTYILHCVKRDAHTSLMRTIPLSRARRAAQKGAFFSSHCGTRRVSADSSSAIKNHYARLWRNTRALRAQYATAKQPLLKPLKTLKPLVSAQLLRSSRKGLVLPLVMVLVLVFVMPLVPVALRRLAVQKWEKCFL